MRRKDAKPLFGVRNPRKTNVKRNIHLLEPYKNVTAKEDVSKDIFKVNKGLAENLIDKGKAVEVKEEKSLYETKEEKFQPETKDFSDLTVKQITEKIDEFTLEDLAILLKDERVTVQRLAKEEIARREG